MRRAAVWLASAVIVLAALTVVAHVGSALKSLHAKAKLNDSYVGRGRTLAAADSLNIDNSWVGAALDLLGPRATYAVVLPSRQAVADGRLGEITYDALPPYMRYLLLPRREVAPRDAQFVLCYGCARHFAGVRWIWDGGPDTKIPGLKIGVRRGT